MDIEIHAERPDEIQEFKRLVKAPFLMSEAKIAAVDASPDWTLCAFERGKLASTFTLWLTNLRFNGNPLSVFHCNSGKHP